jgi:hypothetical protein
MAEVPFNQRPYHLFISYAHADANFVSALVAWLTRTAGLAVWHDERTLQAGGMIGTELPEAIRLATAALFVVSAASLKSGWVKEEYNAAIAQRAKHAEYRIIVVKLDQAEPPGLFETTKWIDAPQAELTAELGLRILLGMYADGDVSPRRDRDLYISRSWRATESEPADSICRILAGRGYRLIGDSIDQRIFDAAERIPALVRSCGATIGIAPNRNGRTSQYIEDELLIAAKHAVPTVAILDQGVVLSESLLSALPGERLLSLKHTLENGGTLLSDTIDEAFRPAQRPHYTFYAASLLKSPDTNQRIQLLIDAVTGTNCVFGENLEGQHVQEEIVRSIAGALFMIADVSEDGGVNTLIEAGVALGSGTRLHLVARGEQRAPRFMFRGIEVHFYIDELQLIGKVHRIARPYRRRILNRELGR